MAGIDRIRSRMSVYRKEPVPQSGEAVRYIAQSEPYHPECGASFASGSDVYFDIETVGLKAGPQSPAFLIGWARNNPGTGELSAGQLLLTDPSGEPAMLEEVAKLMRGWQESGIRIVSFNGKSFDIPYLKKRAAYLNVRFREPGHLDLYHELRRLYPQKPSRLADAERILLTYTRTDDVPGSQAGQLWFEAMRSGDMSGLSGVLRHNLLDLYSLCALHRKVQETEADPLRMPRGYLKRQAGTERIEIIRCKSLRDGDDWFFAGESATLSKNWLLAFKAYKRSWLLGTSKAGPKAVECALRLGRYKTAGRWIDRGLATAEASLQARYAALAAKRAKILEKKRND